MSLYSSFEGTVGTERERQTDRQTERV